MDKKSVVLERIERAEYYLRVPPDIIDAEDAIAWTFGEMRGSYQLVVET